MGKRLRLEKEVFQQRDLAQGTKCGLGRWDRQRHLVRHLCWVRVDEEMLRLGLAHRAARNTRVVDSERVHEEVALRPGRRVASQASE
jgi:hypothetical protein